MFNNLRAFDVVPVVTESLVMNIAGQVLTFLGLIGVIVDPTTAGVGDSERALGYEEPWEDPEKWIVPTVPVLGLASSEAGLIFFFGEYSDVDEVGFHWLAN